MFDFSFGIVHVSFGYVIRCFLCDITRQITKATKPLARACGMKSMETELGSFASISTSIYRYRI
jgi:hypothetical protein